MVLQVRAELAGIIYIAEVLHVFEVTNRHCRTELVEGVKVVLISFDLENLKVWMTPRVTAEQG